jgi:hypothetical protein
VLKALDRLEPDVEVGKKRSDEPVRAKKAEAKGLVLDVQDLSSEHTICITVQVSAQVLSAYIDISRVGSAPVEIENKELL